MSTYEGDASLDMPRWLGVTWKGEALIASARRARYLEIAKRLLASGHAYLCYASEADLDIAFRKAKSLGFSKGKIARRTQSQRPDMAGMLVL
jgi:glutamyl/glutaminyl-tRNA synthetase